MSQRFHQGNLMGFPNGYNERSLMMKQGDNWINQRDNSFSIQGFEQVEAPPPPPPQVYDAGGPMSAAADIVLNDQIQSSFRWPQKPQLPVTVLSLQENSKITTEDGLQLMQSHVMKPSSSSSTSSLHHLQGYHLVSSGILTTVDPPNSQFTWTRNNSQSSNSVYGQGLSLSLSSSLTDMEINKFQELRTGDGTGIYFFDPGLGSTMNFFGYKNLEINQPSLGLTGQTSQIHLGLPTSSRMMNNSLYLKATQELLEEFCCVGRGYLRNPRVKNGSPKSGNRGGGPAPSTTSKERPPLSAAERTEYQRRKAKLMSMLDEVNARYTHYCEQMQGVVNSFDTVMGHGAAAPYTILAQKAMSKHFRNIKDAIVAQVKLTCELLGDKDVTGTIGLTKGETPRLKMLEQKFRQQKSINQLGFLDPEAWRPQRGLPERSVNILRSWLFDHFLNPYPSEADKHLLARQTGLSKNQVSNWFINARVRLWKPMVEEIYKEEAKDEEQEETRTQDNPQNKSKVDHQNVVPSAQKSMQNYKMDSSSREKTTTTVEINAEEKDPSKNMIINYGQCSLGNEEVVQYQGKTSTTSRNNSNMISIPTPPHQRNDDSFAVYGCFTAIPSPETAMHSRNLDHDQDQDDRDEYGTNIIDPSLMGSQAGDPVSLTLGLYRSDFSIQKMYYQ